MESVAPKSSEFSLRSISPAPYLDDGEAIHRGAILSECLALTGFDKTKQRQCLYAEDLQFP